MKGTSLWDHALERKERVAAGDSEAKNKKEKSLKGINERGKEIEREREKEREKGG